MKIKNKLLLLSTLTIVLASVVITYINHAQLQDHFDGEDDTRTRNSIHLAYDFLIRETDKFYTNRAYANLRSYGVKEALADKDRKRLYELTLPRWKTLSQENPYLHRMHFHLADGSSFLRMHKPEQHSDQIAVMRPMLEAVHNERKIITGYEEGVHGLAYRIVVPVIHDSRYIGALEFGIDPVYFSQRLHDMTGHQTMLLMEKGLLRQTEASPTYFGRYVGMQLNEAARRLVAAYSDASPLQPVAKLSVGTQRYLYTALSLQNFKHDEIGVVLFSADITSQVDYLRRLITNNLIAMLVIIVGITLIFRAGYRRFIDRLTFSERFLELIFNAQKNLVVVTDGRELLRANRAVYDFFGYDDFDAFREAHDCICDYFISDPHQEYLQPQMGHLNWSEYIMEHPEREHKVKMIRGGASHIFSLNAERMEYGSISRMVVVFTDITVLERLAHDDQLTGVANRRSFEESLSREMANARRHNYPLSLIYLDIDHFKQVNDTYGHHVGDALLCHVTDVLQTRLRSSDLLGRWGGEEFIVLLPYTDLSNATEIAEELRQALSAAPYEEHRLTCSFGVTALLGEDRIETLIHRADNALYEAKNAGRNCVRHA